MKAKLIVIALLAFSLQACDHSESHSGGSGSGAGGGGSSETPAMKAAVDKCANTPVATGVDMRYVINENHDGAACTTDCQISHSKNEYCHTLQDDQLNNNCAKAEREKHYQESCS